MLERIRFEPPENQEVVGYWRSSVLDLSRPIASFLTGTMTAVFLVRMIYLAGIDLSPRMIAGITIFYLWLVFKPLWWDAAKWYKTVWIVTRNTSNSGHKGQIYEIEEDIIISAKGGSSFKEDPITAQWPSFKTYRSIGLVWWGILTGEKVEHIILDDPGRAIVIEGNMIPIAFRKAVSKLKNEDQKLPANLPLDIQGMYAVKSLVSAGLMDKAQGKEAVNQMLRHRLEEAA